MPIKYVLNNICFFLSFIFVYKGYAELHSEHKFHMVIMRWNYEELRYLVPRVLQNYIYYYLPTHLPIYLFISVFYLPTHPPSLPATYLPINQPTNQPKLLLSTYDKT